MPLDLRHPLHEPTCISSVSPDQFEPAETFGQKRQEQLCAIAILLATDFLQLYRYASVGLALFSMLTIASLFVLRYRRPDMKRPFRVPGYPVVPALFVGVTAFMAVFAFQQWPKPSLYSVGSIVAGVPIYYAWSYLRRVG